MAEHLTLTQHRERLAAALASLRGLEAVLWQASSTESATDLARLLREVDDLGGACDAARVAVTGEAMARGETSGGAAAMTVTQWVRHHAPTTRAGGAGQVVALATAFTKPANAAVKA